MQHHDPERPPSLPSERPSALLRLGPPSPPEAESATPLLGQRVGAYRLVRVLGQGGMGVVYEAVHQRLGRRAAIKTLVHRYSQDRAMVARFFTEARAVNIVRHPGLVSIYEMGCLPDGTAYIVMEYLDGETLRERINAAGPRPLLEAIRLGRQIASALQAVHRRGVVHRDLKPDNIMIVADPDMPGGERAKVVDFGLAQIAEERQGEATRTRTGIVMGTPRYMSPEQCRGVRPITDRADVYALGLNLYQLIAGQPVFHAEAMGDLLVMQISHAPPPLRAAAPAVPEALAALVHEMLDKAPERRPSMAQVAGALELIEAGLPAEPSTGLARDARRSVRGPQSGASSSGAQDSARHTARVPMLWGRPRAPASASLHPLMVPVPRAPSLPWNTEVAPAPPAGEPPEEGSMIVPGARRGRFLVTVVLAGLVASGAWAGSAAGAARWARRLVQGPPAPAPEAAAIWLLDAERALQARAWGEALRRADLVLALQRLSPELREEARSRRERAEKELKAEGAYERFEEAVAERRHDDAVAAFQALPADSVYVGLARPSYEKAFQPFAAAHLHRARAARAAGRCADFREQIAEVLRVEPRHPASLRLQASACDHRRASDGE